MKRVFLFVCILAHLIPIDARAQAKRPMTVEDLFKFKRVSDPQISPDGKWVAYVVTSVDLEKNSTNADIWLASTDGKERKQLTGSPRADRHPRWRPDGKQILFESSRSGENQLWVISLDGGEARQVTTISTEAANGIWSPDGTHIAFVSAVYPEFSEKPFKESNEANKKKMDEVKNNPVKAKVFTKLFYRHWDSYVEGKRQHLFVMKAPPDRSASDGSVDPSLALRAGNEPRDVTPGDRDAFPTSTTFESDVSYTFSPDAKFLVFTAVPKENEAWSTNYDICRVSIDNKSKDWECLTKDNPAADSGPQFSPDGKKLAYRAQKKPGYEADKWELMVVEADLKGAFQGQSRSVTATGHGKKTANYDGVFDSSVEAFAWEGDSQNILLVAEKTGQLMFFAASVDRRHVDWGAPVAYRALSLSRDGKMLALTQEAMVAPPAVSIYGSSVGTPLKQLTQTEVLIDANEKLLAELDLPEPESATVSGAGRTPMQMWILKPPGFDASKKWPLVYLVHGGPQSAWLDGWSYRWNPQLWAAQGYVVAMPNPRGSTGFGQKYVDEISGDWGGKCFEDLMKGLEYLEKQPYIDKDRMAAAGASFGGYMMNWFQGNTTKFKTLITHCSVYNNESMYATTDELWFDEWDFGGKPPWENLEAYRKHSPHLKAKNFKTPMLVIHNDLDFRCPVGEGHQLFTTLQRLGVPSKFINFPDEGHWVLKPKNSEFWHKEVFAWLKQYCPPGAR